MVCRVVPSVVGSGIGVGEGNNLRAGVDVGVGWEAVVWVGLGTYKGGGSGNEERGLERVAKRDQLLPLSASRAEPNVGSSVLTSTSTRQRVPKMSNPETRSDMPHRLPNRCRNLSKHLSLLISPLFLTKDTAIGQDCQATPNPYSSS